MTEPPYLDSDCWILSGPTASGKTSLAITMAKQLNAEIISVDSMAVYTGLDIGTAKPDATQRQIVPHHCLDLVPPEKTFSVAHWLHASSDAIKVIRNRGKKVLFVGGTPLYLRSLCNGLAPLPPENPTLRQQLEHDANTHGLQYLHSQLQTRDPLAASQIHPNDKKRIIRALEVIETTGHPLSDIRQTAKVNSHFRSPTFLSQMLILDMPRANLYQRIGKRVDNMFCSGLLEETHHAMAHGGFGATACQAPGYAEAIAFHNKQVALDEAIEQTKKRTRQLAKRQLTWLRSFKNAIWITA